MRRVIIKYVRKFSGVLLVVGLGSQAACFAAADSRSPQEILKTFREPIVLERADMSKDGGTRMIQLIDASSQTLTFCLDGRMKLWKSWYRPPAKTDPQLYFGAHPRSPEAKAIPVDRKSTRLNSSH